MRPKIIINSQAIIDNARALQQLATEHGVQITPVAKALAGYAPLITKLVELGFSRVGDSSLLHLAAYQQLTVDKWLVRAPLPDDANKAVELSTGALVSERTTIKALSAAATAAGKDYQLLLMAELGDLREGCEQEELLQLVEYAERLPHIKLMGLGANLSCYGNILPDMANMAYLVELFNAAQQQVGRELPLLSAGNSSSLAMLKAGDLPQEINDLRLGESILLGMLPCYDVPLPYLQQNTCIIEAQIVELKEKPSLPWGDTGCTDSFGGIAGQFVDKGRRQRALVALGKQMLYCAGLVPLDPGIELLGGSSDYLVLDISDSDKPYQLGSTIAFGADYAALATAMSSIYLDKILL